MSLAELLADVPIARTTRRGPTPACEVYAKHVTLTDLLALKERRDNGEEWRDQQRLVDERLQITKPIKLDHFRYHWNGKCAHWDGIEVGE